MTAPVNVSNGEHNDGAQQQLQDGDECAILRDFNRGRDPRSTSCWALTGPAHQRWAGSTAGTRWRTAKPMTNTTGHLSGNCAGPSRLGHQRRWRLKQQPRPPGLGAAAPQGQGGWLSDEGKARAGLSVLPRVLRSPLGRSTAQRGKTRKFANLS